MKHDHRQSLWILTGGYFAWCYRCGAIRQLEHRSGSLAYADKTRWVRPTGLRGANPALSTRNDSK